jgi:hypothetical protein
MEWPCVTPRHSKSDLYHKIGFLSVTIWEQADGWTVAEDGGWRNCATDSGGWALVSMLRFFAVPLDLWSAALMPLRRCLADEH